MCDDFPRSQEIKFVNMLCHFDMTSNFGIRSMSNNLLQGCLIQYIMASNYDTLNVGLPNLGWINDEHYNWQGINMCFTYICKLSCDACVIVTNDLRGYFNTCFCDKVNVQLGRTIKTDDKYIYLVSFISMFIE